MLLQLPPLDTHIKELISGLAEEAGKRSAIKNTNAAPQEVGLDPPFGHHVRLFSGRHVRLLPPGGLQYARPRPWVQSVGGGETDIRVSACVTTASTGQVVVLVI